MQRIAELTKIKNDAIINENYDIAKESKFKIKEIYDNIEQIIEKVDSLYPDNDSSFEEPIKPKNESLIDKDKSRNKSKSPEKLKTEKSERKSIQKTELKTEKSERKSIQKTELKTEKSEKKLTKINNDPEFDDYEQISENGSASYSNDNLNNPEDVKIKPKLTFEELLELELQKEGNAENQIEKVKPKKNFLKKGKLINEI